MTQINTSPVYTPVSQPAAPTTPPTVATDPTTTTPAAGGVGGFQPAVPTTAEAPTPAVTSAPTLPAPDPTLYGGDLNAAVQSAMQNFALAKSKNAEAQVQDAKSSVAQVGAARLKTLQDAAAKADVNIIQAAINYATKNPDRLIGFALTLAPAIISAVPTGGASLVAAAPALAGQALVMVNGVMSEAGVDVRGFLSNISQTVLIAMDVDPVQASLISDTATAGLFVAIDIGVAIASGGKTLPDPQNMGLLAEKIGSLAGVSLYAAGNLNAIVTQLSSLAIGVGSGLATAGLAYGGLNDVIAKGGDLAKLVGNAAQGNIDIAALTTGWTDMQALMNALMQQLNEDLGGDFQTLYAKIVETYQQIESFAQQKGELTPQVPQTPSYA